MDRPYDLIVIGGGAAGFFGAINAASFNSNLKIAILEKSNKLLSKVRVSGGGRCNVTHHCFEPTPLAKHYPRGQKELKKLFRTFQAKDTMKWFEERGVKLKVEGDGRMFPITDQSETIINCFLEEAEKYKIAIERNCEVENMEVIESDGFKITTRNKLSFVCKKILVAVGGYPKLQSFDWIRNLGLEIISPIPSLFTFNDSEKKFKDLMGVAVSNVEVKIAGTHFSESGPVLLTHWGLSGPAVIKLSAWAADYLYQHHYTFTAMVNWLGNLKEDRVRTLLEDYKTQHPKQQIYNHPLFSLSARLWSRLCELSEIETTKIWSEVSKKHQNRLIENLTRCTFNIKGKTTFKEEFVTCGGVDLKEIDLDTMQSRKLPGLYFAGEVLNIDGETGGFNFQSAWTTAYVAAKAISVN